MSSLRRITACRGLSLAQRRSAAKLVRLAFPLPYEGLNEGAMINLLADELAQEEGELAEAKALLTDREEVCALIAWYRSTEMKTRQSASLHFALSNLSHENAINLLSGLQKTRSMPPVPESCYLARL